MKRDGACTSLWQNNQPDYQPTNSYDANKTYDVVIAGGGITGITTALLLQKAGKSCLVAEAHNLCFGTTGGTTAHLNTFLDANYDKIRSDFGEHGTQLVGRATRQALDLFKQHIREYNIDCGYEEKDGFLYSTNEKQTEHLQKIFEASQQAGVAVAYTDQIPVPIEFESAIVYSGQAQIHPSRYVYALAKAFEAAGGVIMQECLVENVDGKEVLDIDTNRGQLKTRNLIYATHIPPGVNLLHFRCAPYRSYAMAVTLKDGNYPNGLAYDMYDPYHYYRTQEVDGVRYLIAGGEDHKTAHESNTEACFMRLESYLRKYYNIDKIAFRWSSQYFEPSDGLAYIGHLPGNPENVFVATGFGGNGITYSHIAAITLTDLIVDGTSPYGHLFAPGRVKPVAGFTNFVKEAADVVVQFFGKRFGQSDIQEIADLAPGEARVVKYDGDSIALYKDEKGKLYAVNPVCPHAKCMVGWNSAEKSWDCPCHGSRFSAEGELLTGPARRGLEQVDIIKEE
ncbi:FAD-dependent oxidoreductase [Chitinophagaceae bacterium LB-8]|uniref:FAD-dependent oxidoreductase n=1 Tax=Paraflavisolibacter caeni TaxID=2982496 RepID=A0A9X2XPL7_9BACT|nr:FAD-dependent oxidoreductase [Paraflavisolibacter caeni]MCU7551653.1 FAD-dependent oxidoreductase [Paraflavisolibacter caeni]